MGDSEYQFSVAGTVDGTEAIHNQPNIRFYGNQRTGSHNNVLSEDGGSSVDNRKSWLQQKADVRAKEDSRTGSIVNGVKWVGDEDSNRCNLCSTLFTKVHRRHHCRCCGHLVCGSCSPSRVVVSEDNKPSRICNDCLLSEKLGAQIERASVSRASMLAAIEEEKAAKAAEAARIKAEKDAEKAAAAEEKARAKAEADAEKAKIKEEKDAEKAKAKEEKVAEKAKAKEEKVAEKAKAKEQKAAEKAKAKEEKEAAKAKAKAEKEAAKSGGDSPCEPAAGGCPNCQSTDDDQ